MEIYINESRPGMDADTEHYIRELEIANDGLQDENEELRKEIHDLKLMVDKAKVMKTDEVMAEMKRDILNHLEQMPAETIRDMVVEIASEVLTEDVAI